MTSKLLKDGDYYLNSVIFLVEDTYFKVPTLVFESESEIFKTMFTLPPPSGGVEGQSGNRPIRLEGVKKDGFKLLMKLFYPRNCLTPPQFSPQEWVHVLKLSTMWAMDKIRSMAIKNIYEAYKDKAHTLFRLGRKYDVDDWIFIAVEALVRRADPMNTEDVKLLGVEEVLKIASIRECYEFGPLGDSFKAKRGPMRLGRLEQLDNRIKAEYALSSIPAKIPAKDRPHYGAFEILFAMQKRQ